MLQAVSVFVPRITSTLMGDNQIQMAESTPVNENNKEHPFMGY
jgi:hypothetical protein